jgi:hypothetical protein
VPNKYCVTWEGSCCVKSGSEESECMEPDVDQVEGDCDDTGSCTCVNPQPTGQDCGDLEEHPKCSGNCS